jgi:uncharacterized protein
MKLSFLTALFLITSQMNAGLHDVPHLTLTASASIKKPADELQFRIGVVTVNDTAEEALATNSYKMRQIISSLEDAGLTNDDYETLQFSINPTYTPYPHNPPVNWKPTINGYEVTNSLLVHTTDLELIGTLIDYATKAGATNITDIRFGIRNPKKYWNEALAAAGANAIRDAETLAKATGVRLIRVLSLNLNQMRVNSPPVHMACFAKAAMDSAPPIEAGDLTIDAQVSLVYEIN